MRTAAVTGVFVMTIMCTVTYILATGPYETNLLNIFDHQLLLLRLMFWFVYTSVKKVMFSSLFESHESSGCKNKGDPFPHGMPYKAIKPGFSFLCLFCIVVSFSLL